MIWGNEGYIIKQYFYNRKENIESTHRPVTAYYALEVKTVFKDKRDEIVKQIYEVNLFGVIYFAFFLPESKNNRRRG